MYKLFGAILRNNFYFYFCLYIRMKINFHFKSTPLKKFSACGGLKPLAPLAILSKIRILARNMPGSLKIRPLPSPPVRLSTPLGSQGAVLILQSNQLELFCYLYLYIEWQVSTQLMLNGT